MGSLERKKNRQIWRARIEQEREKIKERWTIWGEGTFSKKKLRGSVENVGTEEEVDEGLAGFVQGIWTSISRLHVNGRAWINGGTSGPHLKACYIEKGLGLNTLIIFLLSMNSQLGCSVFPCFWKICSGLCLLLFGFFLLFITESFGFLNFCSFWRLNR